MKVKKTGDEDLPSGIPSDPDSDNGKLFFNIKVPNVACLFSLNYFVL